MTIIEQGYENYIVLEISNLFSNSLVQSGYALMQVWMLECLVSKFYLNKIKTLVMMIDGEMERHNILQSIWQRLLHTTINPNIWINQDDFHEGLHHCNPTMHTMHTVGSLLSISILYIVFCNTWMTIYAWEGREKYWLRGWRMA